MGKCSTYSWKMPNVSLVWRWLLYFVQKVSWLVYRNQFPLCQNIKILIIKVSIWAPIHPYKMTKFNLTRNFILDFIEIVIKTLYKIFAIQIGLSVCVWFLKQNEIPSFAQKSRNRLLLRLCRERLCFGSGCFRLIFKRVDVEEKMFWLNFSDCSVTFKGNDIHFFILCLIDMKLHYGDLTDSTCLVKIINEVKPTEIYNLGAQSHVKVKLSHSPNF